MLLEILKKLLRNPKIYTIVFLGVSKLITNNMESERQQISTSGATAEPLFLPRGTIRALLALAMLSASIADYAMGSWTLPDEFHAMTIAAVSYYIGYRSDNAKVKEITY